MVMVLRRGGDAPFSAALAATLSQSRPVAHRNWQSCRFSLTRNLSLLCLVGVAALIGCGESSPPIPESGQYLIEAREALAAGDTAKAKVALDASIAASPNRWAYMERAKLNAREGKDDAVLADCAELLEIDPKDPDIPWLKGELKKPVDQRFKGAFAIPPSYRK